MGLLDKIIELLGAPGSRRYLYVSSDPSNLDSISVGIINAVDLSQTDNLVYLVYPDGLAHTSGAFHGIFCDDGASDPQTLFSHVSLHPGGQLTYVHSLNGDLL